MRTLFLYLEERKLWSYDHQHKRGGQYSACLASTAQLNHMPGHCMASLTSLSYLECGLLLIYLNGLGFFFLLHPGLRQEGTNIESNAKYHSSLGLDVKEHLHIWYRSSQLNSSSPFLNLYARLVLPTQDSRRMKKEEEVDIFFVLE